MKTTIKTTLLTSLLCFAMFTGLKAQDKYDYVIISSAVKTVQKAVVITISNGTDVKRINMDWKDVDQVNNKAIQLIKQKEDEGWELFNVTSTIGDSAGYDKYYLRRKRK